MILEKENLCQVLSYRTIASILIHKNGENDNEKDKFDTDALLEDKESVQELFGDLDEKKIRDLLP